MRFKYYDNTEKKGRSSHVRFRTLHFDYVLRDNEKNKEKSFEDQDTTTANELNLTTRYIARAAHKKRMIIGDRTIKYHDRG